MSTLHRYLLRQVTVTLLMTAGVFTGVLLLGNVLREILPLLLSQHATIGVIAQALGLLIPFVWVFALPMAMLTATLLVFGRFSADQELTAARASGVSLLSLIAPILILSLALCAVSAAVNLEIAPRCRVAYNTLRFSLRTAIFNIQLPEGRPIYDFPDYVVYIGRNRKSVLQDVRLIKLKEKDERNPDSIIYAPYGHLDTDEAKQQLLLTLTNAYYADAVTGMPGSTATVTYRFKLEDLLKSGHKPGVGITDMTFTELCDELHELERRFHLPEKVDASTEELEAKKRSLQKERNSMAEPIRVQIHRRVVFSFACFGFTLIGIPLGIRMHRRETNIGVAMALGLVAVYYALVVVAEALSSHPQLAPHLLIWLPNFLFQAVGAVLLWRANRGR